MFLAHKIELRPTPSQEEYLAKACGSKRHCYNQLLNHFRGEGAPKFSKKVAREFYMKRLRTTYPWYSEVSMVMTRNAIDDLDSAFRHFFRRVKQGSKPGFPRFKRKDVKDSFALREKEKFTVDGRLLRIEKLKTRIKMREKLRFSGTPKQVTISKRAGRYFASILVETDDYNPHCQTKGRVGVDLGIKDLAVLSDGTVFPASQPLKKSLKKLGKLQRKLARKQKGSNRRAKAKLKVAKLHYRVANQRSAVLHELSDHLTRNYKVIVIEDLNVQGMVKNRKLSRAISDAGFGTLRAMLNYKAKLRNVELEVVDRWFPSTRKCCCCGKLYDMPLSKRQMECSCGNVMDRDLNAAVNLENYSLDKFKPDLKRSQESRKTQSFFELAC